MKYGVAGLLLLLVWSGVAAAGQENKFNQALAAIEAHNWQKAKQIRAELGEDYPLNVYLDEERLNETLYSASPEEVEQFHDAYRHTPLANDMRSRALSAFATAERWQAFLMLLNGVPSDLSRYCDYATAKRALDDGDVTNEARNRLLADAYLSSSCRQLVRELIAEGAFNQADLLRLMRHAARHGQGSWLQELADKVDANNAQRHWILALYQDPSQVTQMPFDVSHHAELADIAVAVWVRLDPVAALHFWRKAPQGTFTGHDERVYLGKRLAWYSAISNERYNRQWLDQWLPQVPVESTVEQRARRAIIERDWKGILHWRSLLPVGRQQSAHWQYWAARAHQQLGDNKAAEKLFHQAAQERTFYGFMAAKRLGLPLALNNSAKPSHQQLHLGKYQRATLDRVRLLLAADHDDEARREWYYLLAQTDRANYSPLARYALLKHWYNFAIMTAIRGGEHDNMRWRFPLAWQETFHHAAKNVGRDEGFLMMAVARRESAFFAGARSSAGAMGLMQLMPATAEQVAKRMGIQLSDGDLYDASINLTLGADYLDGLLSRYRGNRVLALAAYNAGPQRVDQWLRDQPVPADVWIESIPFYETRAYVKAVLAYRAIFMRRAAVASEDIDLLGQAAQHFTYTHQAMEQEVSMVTP